MGTTTLFISDGETTLITDGYFTRASIDLSTGPGALVEPSSPEWLIFSNWQLRTDIYCTKDRIALIQSAHIRRGLAFFLFEH
jgi:hypothetical protein